MGSGIGWLVGLSVSAVVGGVIASLLSIGAGIVSGLQAVQLGKGDTGNGGAHIYYVDARPAAMLILGIALAAPCGILARTHHVFEPHQSKLNPPGQSLSYDKQKQYAGVLFGIHREECAQVLDLAMMGNYKAFTEQLLVSDIPLAKEITSRFQGDPHTLARLVKIICRGSSKE